MITIHVEPQTPPMTWEQFCTEKPPRSIALDGYVVGPPMYDKNGPWLNFNHHEDVDRLSTRCTCAQVLMAIRQGLFDVMKRSNERDISVYVNDCDEDVCLSVFLLQNDHLASSVMNPILNRLVHVEDMLDASAGSFPFPDSMPLLGEIGWVFAPYRHFRLSGEIDNRNPEAFSSVITDVGHRIMAHYTGHGGKVEVDSRYKRIGGGDGWALVEEIGSHARIGMYANGIQAFVSVRKRPDGNYSYAIGRRSQYIDFPLPELIKHFNEVEGITSSDLWGGSPTMGGSPRINGSCQSPGEIETNINRFIADNCCV